MKVGVGAALTLPRPVFGGAAPEFSPSDLSPALWVDPSDASTVTISGSSGAYIGADGLVLPGGTNYAVTPDSAALDITGDMEIIVKATATDWTPAASMTLLCKGNAGGVAQEPYRLSLTASGALVFTTSTGAAFISGTSTGATGLTNGATKWIKVTFDATNGLNSVFEFFLSDDGSTWTQLGSTVTAAINGGIVNVAHPLYVGLYTSAEPWIGTIHRAIIKNGIDGTTVFDADFENATPFVSAFTESALGAPVYVVSSTSASTSRNYGYIGPEGLVLPGLTGNVATTPDSAAVSPTTSVELVTRAQAVWSGNAYVFSKRVGGAEAGTAGMQFTFSAGSMQFFSNNVLRSVTHALTDGAWYWLKITADGTETKFYFAADQATEPSSWTQIGATQGASSFADTGHLFSVGGDSQTTWAPIRIKRLILRKTIGGSADFDADFEAAADYAASFTESSTNAATVTITATNTPANAAGALVSQINDKSGNARHLVQATVSNMPKYWNGRNGNNCLVFRSDDYFSPLSAFTLAQPLSHAYVIQPITASAQNDVYRNTNDPSPNSYYTNTKWAMYAGTVLNSTPNVDLNWHALVNTFNGASSTIRLDGTQVASGAAGSGSYGGAKVVQLGGTAAFLNAVLGETLIAVIAAPTDLEGYMKTKWGTP